MKICLIISLCLLTYVLGCSEPYLSHRHGDKTICCLPTYNCGPDAEIKHCTENLGRDVCQSCRTGYINPFVVSSVDKSEHRCFKKESFHDLCPLDTIPTENIADSSSCLLFCTCNHADCYYGTVPCECEGPQEPCKENETMDPVTGTCVQCPKNSYKLQAGCGPCTWNVTALQGDLETKETVTKSEKFTTGLVIIADRPDYKVNNTESGTEPQEEDKKKDDGFSIVPVIVIVVVLVIAAILLAVILVRYRKLKSNDTSGLLKWYHAFCPGKHWEAEVSQHRETEHITDLPHQTHGSQNQGKQIQQVAPIARANGAPSSPSEAYYGSTIPFAEMSMSPQRPQWPPSVEEVDEEEDQDVSDASPFLDNNTNRDNDDTRDNEEDPDLTAQKTAASLVQ